MKKTIQSIIGSILIIVASAAVFGVFSNSKKAPKNNNTTSLKTVITETVVNKSLPIKIKSTGSILAKDRTILYSEVTGIFEQTSKAYKPGVNYNRGQALIHINNTEYAASVKSQRINFQSIIIGTLADIQFDYPLELTIWKNYANSISSDNILPTLPTTTNENFKNYLSVKSIFGTYYTIKNLETRLAKYTITAPFTGVLVSANITPGTLVSPGQKLGEFIKPGVYELELNVNASMTGYLKIGKTVTLFNTSHTKTYEGVVSRINSLIDRASQTVQLFVEIHSNELTEGEYLEADIEAQNVSNVFEIQRSLIVEQTNVFILKDSLLVKQPISIVHANENTVIIRGIEDASQLISTPIPGGYEGMKVASKN
jgi:membrane fusion protein (multidrug efflux system)